MASSLMEKLDSSRIEATDLVVLQDDSNVTPRRGVQRLRLLTPKSKKIKSLATKLHFLNRKYAQTKVERVKNLKQVISSIEPQVSPVIFSFIRSQLISSSVSKYGHRWSLSDKNLCLQLYLSSPKAYNTLKRFLNLPSKPTLIKIVSGIKMEPGFSTAVLNSIKLIASKIKPHDKYCIISFDEMLLKCGLVYNKKKDKIVGFEDYGSQIQSSSSKLATHAHLLWCVGFAKNGNRLLVSFSYHKQHRLPHRRFY
nr:uncharacterized protein LOC110283341 [Parasteatoda tepidariorum]